MLKTTNKKYIPQIIAVFASIMDQRPMSTKFHVISGSVRSARRRKWSRTAETTVTLSLVSAICCYFGSLESGRDNLQYPDNKNADDGHFLLPRQFEAPYVWNW